MIFRSRYAPGQRIHLEDADLPGRVISVLLTTHGVSYICRWWDGQDFQENEFGQDEIASLESEKDVIMLCGCEDEADAEKAAETARKQ